MNFLSHYYLLPEKDNSAKVIGNLLPDLIRGFSKIYRQEIKHNLNTKDNALVSGIQYHLQTDAIFHQHAFFLEHCEKIKNQIKNQNLPPNRNFIVAHVMLELIIDHYLMEQNEALANNFYLTLNNSNNAELHETLNITLNRQNSSKIITIFSGFIENKYAFRIQSYAGLAAALYQIIGKRIGEEFKSPLWLDVIQESKEQMEKDLPEFLQNLKEALRDA